MGKVEEYKPVMAMIGLQHCYAGVTLSSRATLAKIEDIFFGSKELFVNIHGLAYRVSVFSVLFLKTSNLMNLGLFFFCCCCSITINQNLYFEGLYLASSSMGSAMGNINPAVTFLISFLVGYEKVNIKNIRGLAKIAGTVLCVLGAIYMTLLRGPKILNSESDFSIAKSLLGDVKDQNMWLIGCLFLFSSNLCWSFWLTLQVNFSEIITFVLASALSFTVQAWVVSKRGPLFSSMFNPLCTVIVTILASLFLQEEIFTG
ncbi:hypothetical protein DY000_02036957, partial [Brassica cretica]